MAARQKYTREFKQDAVRLVTEQGYKQTVEDLGPLDSWHSDTEDLGIFDILDAQGWGLV
jgi:hypothetical protein